VLICYHFLSKNLSRPFLLFTRLCSLTYLVDVVILGRALAGAGAAGMFTSVISITAEVTRLEDRPFLFGAFGAVCALGSAIGPLLGGVFTDHFSWRWCFYCTCGSLSPHRIYHSYINRLVANLPFGALTILIVSFLLHSEGALQTEEVKSMTLKQRFILYGFYTVRFLPRV
jgi:MFS family permease